MTESSEQNKAIPSSFGRYRVLDVLGEGGMGRVFLAEDPVLERKIAIKVIRYDPELSAEDRLEYQNRFLLEARASAKLSHPSIVAVFDAGLEEGSPWIAFEYVEGESLEGLLRRKGSCDFSLTVRIVSDIAGALSHAHGKGIVHRDIKPANILIDSRTKTAKLADFGIAKASWTGFTREGITIGSPGYMSPEQIKGQSLDGRSDLFSLGVLGYEMLSGMHPFLRDDLDLTAMAIVTGSFVPLSSFLSHISPELDSCISSCLIADRERRISTADEIGEIVRPLLQRTVPDEKEKTIVAIPTTHNENLRPGKDDPTRVQAVPEPSPAKTIQVADSATRSRTAREYLTIAVAKMNELPNRLLAPRKLRKTILVLSSTAAVVLMLYFLATMMFTPSAEHKPQSPADVLSATSSQELVDEGNLKLKDKDFSGIEDIAGELLQRKNTKLQGQLLLLRNHVTQHQLDDAAMVITEILKIDGGRAFLENAAVQILSDVKEEMTRGKASSDLIDFLANKLNAATSPLVVEWSTDRSYWLRWNAVSLLEKGNIPIDYVPVYIQDLQFAGSWQTRKNAAIKLGDSGDKRAIPALEEARRKTVKDPMVAITANRILREKFRK